MRDKDIKSMSFDEILIDFENLSLKHYRASQVYSWILHGIESFDEMTNIPLSLRDILKSKYFIPTISVKSKKISCDGTVKYLFEFEDGCLVESVLMKYNHGYSICLSTQAGCKMGCAFCETGKNGFCRNLNPSEILLQIESVQKDMNIKVSNIVLMGMGEPLDNYDNVMKFLKLVSDDKGLNIGMRHISLSTCGMVDKIYKLAKEKMQLTLSVSLHASNDEVRNKLMKINKRWNINELIEACKYYIACTNRRISFEYAMIKNLNDTRRAAEELAELLKGVLCHVNLIPLNISDNESVFQKSSLGNIYKFKNILENKGIQTTIRRTLGKDIEAACGQLKGKYANKEVDKIDGSLQQNRYRKSSKN